MLSVDYAAAHSAGLGRCVCDGSVLVFRGDSGVSALGERSSDGGHVE